MNSAKTKNANDLKNAMRQLPFPVTIVTAAVGKEKHGITIGSFTSLSMEPPLISFNVDKQAQIHNLLSRATHFAVHIPQPPHSAYCDHFAVSGQSGDQQFETLDHYRNGYGSPIIKDIDTVIQCRSYNEFPAGDHTIIVGEVIEVDHDIETPSVLYYDRSYRSVGESVPKIADLCKSA